MVKLASTLPKEHDENGLEQNTRHLLERYTSQEYTPAVVLLRTKDVYNTEDFERVPRVECMHIEPAFDADDDAEVRALITRLHDDRVKHIRQPLDLPDLTDDDAADWRQVTRELEAAADTDVPIVDAEIITDTEETQP